MAKVPIAVLWNSTKQELTVHPELAKVYWEKDGPRDIAVWTLVSNDAKVELLKPAFQHGPPNGPFGELKRLATGQWEGSDLARTNKIYKYEVALSNGARLDPALLDEERP